jgi:dTDP-4-dehydrorhamnose reductase
MEKIKDKVLVLGSTGMLGHVLFNYLEQTGNYEMYDLVFKNKLREESIICDITDRKKITDIIKLIEPKYIINCIGVLIRGSQDDPSNAIYINAYFPHFLVKTANHFNAKVIHISTDCVFSGKKGSYTENDFRDADDIYGRSKALGEINNDNHLTIRTSIVGPELKTNGEGLLHWFLNQQQPINGFKKAFWGGVTTLECAKAIGAALEQDLHGLINLTNGSKISKYDMLQLFQKVFEKSDITINAVDGKEVDKSLSSQRNDFKYTVPSYANMFAEMTDNITENRSSYPHYNF